MVSIQFSHTSPSKCRCFSPFGNLMSCSLLTPWFYSFSFFFQWRCHLWYFLRLFPQLFLLWRCHIWYVIIYLTVCTISGIALTTVGTANGSILHLIIFCALKFVLSYSLFTFEHEAPPSSTLFFLVKALLRESTVIFFLFFSVVCISSLILLTLVSGFKGLSF